MRSWRWCRPKTSCKWRFVFKPRRESPYLPTTISNPLFGSFHLTGLPTHASPALDLPTGNPGLSAEVSQSGSSPNLPDSLLPTMPHLFSTGVHSPITVGIPQRGGRHCPPLAAAVLECGGRGTRGRFCFQLTLFMDSSLDSWGAHFVNFAASENWSDQETRLLISALEHLAVIRVLQADPPFGRENGYWWRRTTPLQ